MSSSLGMPSMNSDDSLPFFPPELEREIFESAAELYPDTVPSLLLVSQRVNEWIERVKYNIITEGSSSSCRFGVLHRAVLSDSKPAAFFHDRVRHLFIHESLLRLTGDEIRAILLSCSGIRSLALMYSIGPSVLPGLAVKLQRLCAFSQDIFSTMESPDPSHSMPMFTSVTHLDLFNIPSDSQSIWLWSEFGLLPALTHLSLFKFRTTAVGTALLSKCNKLEALLRMENTYDDPLSIDDIRFVCMILPDADYEEDWILGAKGGMDFWARADAFVAKRRRGEIKPESRCWIENEDGI
ncbi:hypothetical protein C8R44DRAFT_871899 [Mycena epipterygia]|nr:hypothetical protein C8R44DRAFT_871899 [Mycena epipterygia]